RAQAYPMALAKLDVPQWHRDIARRSSALSILHLWVETFEFDAGIMGRKLPVNAFLRRIAPLFPLCGFMDERLQIWDPSVQALYSQGAELDLGDIEPTAMLGGMVDLQTRGQSSG